jgi:hypothetical protein
MNTQVRPSAAVIVCVLGLLAANCSGSEDPAVTVTQSAPAAAPAASETTPAPSASATSPATATPSATDSASTPASGGAATTGTPASAVDEQSASSPQPIAVEDHEVGGVRVALMDIRRTSGDTLTVRFQLRNTTDSGVSNSTFYGDHIVKTMYLIDGSSKKKYLVVRDAEDKPVGYIGQSGTIPAKASIPVWAKFPAPPAGVNTITVVFPGTTPFEDAPIK